MAAPTLAAPLSLKLDAFQFVTMQWAALSKCTPLLLALSCVCKARRRLPSSTFRRALSSDALACIAQEARAVMLLNLASLPKALEVHTSKSPQGCERASRHTLCATVASRAVFAVALRAMERVSVTLSHHAINDVMLVRRTLFDALTVNRSRFCSSIGSLVAVLRALRQSAPNDMVCFAGSFPLYMYLAWMRGCHVDWTQPPNDIDIFVTSVHAFELVAAHIAATFPLARCRETKEGSNYFPSSVRRGAAPLEPWPHRRREGEGAGAQSAAIANRRLPR